MKSNPNFTPGPWSVRQAHGTVWVEAPTTEDDPYFGVVPKNEVMCDEEYPRKLADAQLISTAPDLLKESTALLKTLDDSGNIDLTLWFSNVRKAAACLAQVVERSTTLPEPPEAEKTIKEQLIQKVDHVGDVRL
jgi:hypothetical protein